MRGYRFNMINLLKQELGMNPLVMDLVCYPMISKNEYLEKRLDVVSDETETIFKEDLEEPALLFQKLMGRYNINKSTPHDILDTKRFALIRHHFEPNFDLKESEENLNPGYSRLRIEKNLLSEDKADEIVEEYFKGIKEIVFVDSRESMCLLANKVEEILFRKKLVPLKGNLVVGTRTFDDSNLKDFYSIFNFEVYVLNNIKSYVNDSILIEEGVFDDEQKILLKLLAEMTPFNFQQFEIEHAPSSSNIMVAAGAGTGKTYSMVSRVAYLCNRTADAVVDIVSDIAMITFTKDAAENMNRRLKRMFMNYFVLTSNEKYMHLIEDMSQIQIATIHKFAISLLRKECMRMGIGFDSQISSETFERRNIYHSKLDIYLSEKTEENPNFVHQLTIPSYELEIMLIEFCDQLYNRSIDIKSIDTSLLGNPIESIPYFNELIERVIIPSEIQYANDLKEKNMDSNKTSEELEALRSKKDYAAIELEEITTKLENTTDILIEHNNELESLHKLYTAKGGDAVEKRQETIQKRVELKSELEAEENRAYEIAANELPLALVADLIQDIKLQAVDEHTEAIMQEAILQFDMLLEDFSVIYDGDTKASIDFINFVKEQTQINQEEPIYELSDQALFQVNSLNEKTIDNSCAEMKTIFDKKELLIKQIAELDSYLTLDINDKELQRIYKKIKQVEEKIIQDKVAISDLEQKHAQATSKLNSVSSEFNKYVEAYLATAELRDSLDRTVKYSNMALKIIEKYQVALQKKKVDVLSKTITKCYKQLANKKNLINKIEMDAKTLNVKYLSENNNEVPKESLSAGEQQLMVISILWALAICSKKKLPVIIDTPLSRLDSLHRTALITTYFPNAGEQTIILSTDSEIDANYYELMKENVGDEFTLEYDEISKSTSIKRGYLMGVKV